jgi:hypothetical protein
MRAPVLVALLVALLAVVTLAACGDPATQHHPEVAMSEQPSERRIVPVPQDSLRTLWTRGGEQDDTVMFMPVSITADSDLVFVADVASHEVIAFRAADGSVAWRIGRRGAGPADFDVPMGLAVLPSRELAVIDQRNARIAIVSRAGEVVQHVSLASLALTTSVCGAADGSLLVAAAGERAAEIVRIARDGRIVGRHGLPWAEARSSSPIATQLRLERRGFDGSCFVGLMLGVGFALFDGERFTHVSPYVERLVLPVAERSGRGERLAERQIAIADVSIDEAEIAIAFEGRTAERRRLVDMYDSATGAYRRSYLLGPTVTSMARDGGRFFFLIERRGYLTLEAVELPTSATATR